jgi:dUTP pyrophosphatase
MQMLLRVQKCRGNAILPTYAHEDDAGMDLYAAQDVTIAPGEWAQIATGIALQLPRGYEAQVRPRSGLAMRYGVTMLNAPGTIDAGYRGEICVLMINHGREPFHVRTGDRVAQLVIASLITVQLEECSELSSSERGEKGFGSTGR